MNVELYKIVLQRLEDETFLGALAKRLVTAACEGDEALASALGETGGSPPSEMTAPAGRLPVKACLSSIAVEGFRGIGPESTLSFRSGPGLSLVVGRNGSGKSSFAEALEILLTGDNRRWKDRSAAWKEDWRNLHHGHTRIEATMLVEGDTAPATVCRTWQDGAKDVTSSALEVRRSGRQKGGSMPSGGPATCRSTGPSSPTTSSARCSTTGRLGCTTP